MDFWGCACGCEMVNGHTVTGQKGKTLSSLKTLPVLNRHDVILISVEP
jgi:hypothetical protein